MANEGIHSTANGFASHAEGYATNANGVASHAEGSTNTANGDASHVEGSNNFANGVDAHAEGYFTAAQGFASHAEGSGTIASGNAAHAQGFQTNASGAVSHSEGILTSTAGFTAAHIMGQSGSANESVSWFLVNGGIKAKVSGNTGVGTFTGGTSLGPADYAELFETADGQPIEPGYFVTFAAGTDGLIRLAGAADAYTIGVTSANPGVVGDSADFEWRGKYVRDEWGRTLYRLVPAAEAGALREAAGPGMDALAETQAGAAEPAAGGPPQHGAEQRRWHAAEAAAALARGPQLRLEPVLSGEWDPHRGYVPRAERPEWVAVGLLGKLLVRDDGTCQPGGCCRPAEGGVAAAAQSGYRVIRRTGARQVLILLK